jgi:glycosyltransferase involved in cell wall biosynthesis
MSISIIIKALDEERHIAAAIESALAALPDGTSEVIVADSGSSDRTVEIAATFPVVVVQLVAPAEPSCGIGPQLGFQYSHGDHVCLIDGDMRLDASFLQAAQEFLTAHPKVAGVTGHVVEEAIENLEFAGRVARKSPEKRVGPVDRMNGGGLYRRAALAEIGYFSDRNLHSFEEFDLGVRLRARGWALHRLDRRFVSHYGHTVNAYRLLLRRWRSKYLFGTGELLRGALGKPYWRSMVQELPELRLWAAVYLWWLVLLALPAVAPDKALALGLDLLSIVAAMAVMSWRRRSIALGSYAVVAWWFHALALPVGFLRPRRPPQAWIESRLIAGKV